MSRTVRRNRKRERAEAIRRAKIERAGETAERVLFALREETWRMARTAHWVSVVTGAPFPTDCPGPEEVEKQAKRAATMLRGWM